LDLQVGGKYRLGKKIGSGSFGEHQETTTPPSLLSIPLPSSAACSLQCPWQIHQCAPHFTNTLACPTTFLMHLTSLMACFLHLMPLLSASGFNINTCSLTHCASAPRHMYPCLSLCASLPFHHMHPHLITYIPTFSLCASMPSRHVHPHFFIMHIHPHLFIMCTHTFSLHASTFIPSKSFSPCYTLHVCSWSAFPFDVANVSGLLSESPFLLTCRMFAPQELLPL